MHQMAMAATVSTRDVKVAPPKEYIPGTVHISDSFDAGNIICEETSVDAVRLRIKPDPYTAGTDNCHHMQWFYFRASNVKGRKVKYDIVNAGDASYKSAWPGYNTCASYDRRAWFRVRDTEFSEETGSLSWSLDAEHETVWFAYFAPYSYEQHQELIARVAASPLARLVVLGDTLDGRPLEMLTMGTGPRKVWIVARQHPGESMAEWLAQGVLDKLFDDSAESQVLMSAATFYIIPNINPDGSVRGHLRTNASGANLNREWASTGDYMAPTLERSPEVYHTLRALDALGCDCYVDVHGDEEIAANFFADNAGIPGYSTRQDKLHKDFLAAMMAASDEFQTELGYGSDEPNMANMAICQNQIAARFDCLAVTLEMPFKDNLNKPDLIHGWSPERSMRLGHSLLSAIGTMLPALRG